MWSISTPISNAELLGEPLVSNARREMAQFSGLRAGSLRVGNNPKTIYADRRRLFPRPQLLCHLLRRGDRLNRHHFPHHAAIYRSPFTSELVQFLLVSIQRVNLLPYNQRVLRAFLYALSGALRRTLVLFHVVSATHGVADSSGQHFWRCGSLRWLARPRGARRHLHLSGHEHGGKM